MNYTDDFIDQLFSCVKTFIDPPSKEYREDRGHMKKNFTLQSIDRQFFFKGFVRFNIRFLENFSIGLDFDPKEVRGSICLLRCNGNHGENVVFPLHSSCHIHRATAYTINEGLKPESHIEQTTAYVSIDEAIQYYIKLINLDPAEGERHFPPKQLNLFSEND